MRCPTPLLIRYSKEVELVARLVELPKIEYSNYYEAGKFIIKIRHSLPHAILHVRQLHGHPEPEETHALGSVHMKALIPNWEVQFNYYSTNYRGGVTGIEPAINKLVRGAVYEIPPDEMEHLDTIEGVPNGTYYRHPLMVVSEVGEPMLAHVYRTTNPRGPFNPTKLYLKYMIDGARTLGLPEEYIKALQRETID